MIPDLPQKAGEGFLPRFFNSGLRQMPAVPFLIFDFASLLCYIC